jgi:hypothetical protein
METDATILQSQIIVKKGCTYFMYIKEGCTYTKHMSLDKINWVKWAKGVDPIEVLRELANS